MTLEERYNNAAVSSYVGKVRMMQAAEAGAIKGTNFLDGDGRNSWSPGSTPPPDVVQDEFNRNKEGAFRYGGEGKSPAATNDKSYPLSRWLARGVEKGEDYLANARYNSLVAGDVRNAPNTIVHKFSHLSGKSFYDFLSSPVSKGKITGSPSGPSPSGVNG